MPPLSTHWAMRLGLALVPLLSAAANAQVSCDFKGVSVGDKLAREQLMQRLGVKNFKLDPPMLSFDETHLLIEKYGINGASEREDDGIGPYCRESSCNIPFGISVGDDHIPVKVFVALKSDMVYAIEVSFNTIFWNDFWDIMVITYGPAWKIERDDMPVMDYETQKVDHLERITVTHKLGRINPQTKDTCTLAATNIDIIFRHHDSLGTLHAIFSIS